MLGRYFIFMMPIIAILTEKYFLSGTIDNCYLILTFFTNYFFKLILMLLVKGEMNDIAWKDLHFFIKSELVLIYFIFFVLLLVKDRVKAVRAPLKLIIEILFINGITSPRAYLHYQQFMFFFFFRIYIYLPEGKLHSSLIWNLKTFLANSFYPV